MGSAKTLFLDIDGVLHANSIGELEHDATRPKVTGSRVCELEGLLADLVSGISVEIVIHSTWVYMFSAETLATDYLPKLSKVAKISVTKRQISSRVGRIQDYIRRRRLALSDVLILDDAAAEFVAAPRLGVGS